MRASPRLSPRLGLGLGAALLSLTLGGCAGEATSAMVPRTLVIGIGDDVPGFSTIDEDGREVGFDIDVARYVARGLGWSDDDIEYLRLPDSTRDRALQSGEVDLVVSTYRMSPASERLVDFAGPYLDARQDLLVAADDATVTGPHSLGGATVCSVAGSPDAGVLTQPRFSPAARLRSADTLAQCVADLRAGLVDVVTGDDVVLARYASQTPEALKVVESPFVAHRYGLGLPEGSPDVAVIDDLLAEMISSGAWRESYLRYLATSGTTVPDPPVPDSAP